MRIFPSSAHVELPYLSEDLSQAHAMVSAASCFGDNIIYIYLHNFSNLHGKNQIHKPLVAETSILQTKRHYCITTSCIFRYKGHFLLIRGMHLNLVVGRIHIHEAEESCL